MPAKALNIKFYLLITLFLVCLFLILSPKIRVFAQVPPCPTPAAGKPAIVRDLASALSIGSLTTQGTCITGDKASVDPGAFYVHLDSYDALKSTFFTKSKSPATKNILPLGDKTQANLGTISAETLFNVQGNLTMGGNPAGTKTAVIFVDGNLIINSNITYGSTGTYGLVFVVGGDVFISRASTLNQIYGVIIAQGQICTAASGSVCEATFYPTTTILNINGGLIALDRDKPILFRRQYSTTDSPSEVINFAPKFLVNLRDLMSTNILIIGEEE